MATTGTYTFAPALSDIVLNAFSRIGIKRTELTAQHLADAGHESNLTLVRMSNHQPNLWTSNLITVPTVSGTATYTLPVETVAILVAYITVTSGTSVTDRVISPVSTVEYASFPKKTQAGVPTVFWFNRQITPQITLWQVPNSAATYSLKLQTVRQVQDASLPSGVGLDIPYRAYDAFTADLAHRLSRHYAKDIEAQRKADANDAWKEFMDQDQEDVPMFIIPGLASYTGF